MASFVDPVLDLRSVPTQQGADFTKVSITSGTLGTVELAGFEIPQTIPLGGTQRTVVTQLVGRNRREVQVLGAQPRVLEWEGIFLYDTALGRAKYLDQIRLEGDPVKVEWGEFSFSAVISQFFYDPKSTFNVPYKIALEVVKQDFDRLTVHAVESRDSIPDGLGKLLTAILDAKTLVERGIVIATAIRKGDFNSLVGAVNTFSSVLGDALPTIAGISPTDATSFASQATLIASSARNLTNNLIVDGDFSNPITETLIIANTATTLAALLTRLSLPVATDSAVVMNTNLFRLAVDAYGTVDAWEVVANANNLSDTLVTAPTKLSFPPFQGKNPQLQGLPGSVYEAGAAVTPNSREP